MVFDRDLLYDGLIAAAGTGWIQAQPGPHSARRVQLSSPSGQAVFTTCAQTLSDFLHQAYVAAPPDTEYSWLDFDGALSDLLNGPAHD